MHNKMNCNAYSSPNIINVIKPTNMRWARPLARTEETRSVYNILVGTSVGQKLCGMR
jgi:hypothetical protein